jgi:hypothetical protein
MIRIDRKQAFAAFTAAALFVGAGCAAAEDPYVYRPEQASVLVDGLPGTRYPAPPETPQGEVRIASFGVTEIGESAGAPGIAALHVRMVVANNGDATPWQIDTRTQEIEVPGEGRSAPLYINGNFAPAPVVSVAWREQRTIDLYFPLPATVNGSLQLPRFDFLWQVQTGQRMVADRTVFERQEAEDPVVYRRVTVVAGWGPWWWYNPRFGRVVYVHPRPIVIHDHSRPPTIVVPRPHRLYVGRPVSPRPPRPRPR